MEGEELRIRIAGRFDFKCHEAFREAYHGRLRSGLHITVDLARTEYMDSSALGMLLVLRKEAEKHARIAISLVGGSETISRILEIAGFHTLFAVTQ